MIDTIYNHLAVQYTSRAPVKYQTHKRSELRNIYMNIVNMNKRSPLYMFRLSDDTQSYAIHLKDASMTLNSSVKAFLDPEGTEAFHSRKAVSDHPAVDADIVTDDMSSLPAPFNVNIHNLALAQQNAGRKVLSDSKVFEEGDYHFTVNVEGAVYDFQINIPEKMSNYDLEVMLASHINKANIGIHASVETSQNGAYSNMLLESEETGCSDGGIIFSLKDTSMPKENGIVDYFELNHVSRHPENAVFELNGERKESLSNTFTIGKAVRLTLHDITDTPVQISYTADGSKISSLLDSMVDSYNSMVEIANVHSEKQKGAKTLLHDLNDITYYYKNELESCGITTNRNGTLTVDPSVAVQAADSGDLERLLKESDGFTNAILNKTNYVSLDPMNYLDKTIVTYPNYKKIPFPNPYITSMYSGMLFNFYC